MNSSTISSLHADSPDAGLRLARRLAERQLAQSDGDNQPADMAAHLRASSPPHITELAAQFFATVAAANRHWLR